MQYAIVEHEARTSGQRAWRLLWHVLAGARHQQLWAGRLMLINQFVADECWIAKVVGQPVLTAGKLSGAHCQRNVVQCHHDVKRVRPLMLGGHVGRVDMPELGRAAGI